MRLKIRNKFRLAVLFTMMSSTAGCVTSLVCSEKEMGAMSGSGFSSEEIKKHCLRTTVDNQAIEGLLTNIEHGASTVEKLTKTADQVKRVLDKFSGDNK